VAKQLPATQGEIVPLSVIQPIADRNAAEVWGEVQGTEPIPYFWIDGEVIAWRFNYARGMTFPAAAELKAQSADRGAKGDFQGQWGDGEYASLLMSARSDMPPFLERREGLSPEYTLGAKIDRQATTALATNGNPGRTYLLGLNDIWYEFTAPGKTVAVNPTPPALTMTGPEFQEHLQAQSSFFVATEDFQAEWDDFANGTRTLSRDNVLIAWHEHMPYVRWNYGCSPTSGAMLLSWWDNISLEREYKYANLVRHHFQRWESILEEETYHVPNSTYDLKVAMDTNDEGSTWIQDIADGIIEVAEDCGYGASGDWYYFHDYDWLYDYLRDWIDGGAPLLSGIIGHTMTCVGYNSANSEYINHDPNSGTLDYRHKNTLDHVVVASMNSSWDRDAVKVTSPVGDTGWNGIAGDGETYSDGDFCSITWDGDYSPDTFASI